MHAIRNINLCTKDCLCLYVCPTGATDTETGQIDASRCLDGCRICIDACPSHAISLIPAAFPAQQRKTDTVKKTLLSLAESKVKQEQIAAYIEKNTDNPVLKQLAQVLCISNQLMAEDLIRESGYMLPQSQNVQDFLKLLLDTDQPEGFPKEVVERLLAILNLENLDQTE
ncbi:4Fe-4S ferredoxin [Acetobacterium bakii]|uniref:4Fe-4S ferredoxin n=1 Tax=Acetobacterium bakii TaxID=52689 RepID=A0A0L6TWT2_9FIRM|nr:4Fe-4S ferredoxin [Acetobacterium bakii]KNZ40713.1 4Fe-4S ferredoxin [Acetobacterium bakii]